MGGRIRQTDSAEGKGFVANVNSVDGFEAHSDTSGNVKVDARSDFNPFSSIFDSSGSMLGSKAPAPNTEFVAEVASEASNSSTTLSTEASADVAVENMRNALKAMNETNVLRPNLHAGTLDAVKPAHQRTHTHVKEPLRHSNASATGKPSGLVGRTVAPVDRTCRLGVEDECQSVCRWLKLVAKDEGSNATCPLFEWSLKSCGYELPEGREHHTDDMSALDCTIQLLRLDVLASDMDSYVHQLEDCVHGLPTSLRDRCHVAVDLLTNEMGDWGKAAELKVSVDGTRRRLQLAASKAKASFESKTYEQDAIDSLSLALSEAEKLPGHYLSQDLHSARELLDKLGPLPAARAELRDAIDGGKHALITKAAPDVSEAFVRLNVSVTDAEELGLGSPLRAGKELLADLGRLHSGLAALERATFEGNVSLGERGDLVPAIRALNASILAAVEMKLPGSSVSPARTVLARLEITGTTLHALREATDHGKKIMATESQGRSTLGAAVVKLNATIAAADALGAGSDSASVEAMETHNKLVFALRAREALHDAIARGKTALLENNEVLNNSAEIMALHSIEPAIEWGKVAGLHHGLPVAKQVVHFLRIVDSAKQNMTLALAQANSTLNAKAGGEASAIHALELAIDECNGLKLTGGVAEARDRLAILNTMRAARTHLDLAQASASASLSSMRGEDQAAARLNASIFEARAVGLDSQASAAAAQLQQLQAAADARTKLAETLRRPLPMGSTWPELNGANLVVMDLPDVVRGTDSDREDDASFAEHLKALNEAIAEAHNMQLSDPDLELQLRRLTGMRDAYERLRAALSLGEHAMSSKVFVDSAVGQLARAVGEAKGRGLRLGVARGAALLVNLSRLKPVREELFAAVIEANISHRTMNHMAEAQVRLDAAVASGKELGLPVEEASALSESLSALKAAFVDLQAAVVQGQIALDREEGEEEAIASLKKAVEAAEQIGILRDIPVARDLIQELGHMNAEHQQIATAVGSKRDAAA